MRLLLPAAVLVPIGLQGLGAWVTWNAVWEQAQSEVAATADAAAEYVRSVLEVHRLQAERVNDALRGLSDSEIRAREAELQARLRAIQQGAAQREEFRIYVFGRDATVVVNTDSLPSPTGSYADRDYIRAVREPGAPRLALGEALTGRANAQIFFAITLRRDSAGEETTGGGFPGAVNISVVPAAIGDGLRRLAGQSEDVVSLVRSDGSVLARTLPIAGPPPWRQPPAAETAARMAAGEPRFLRYAPSPVDGVYRLAAYRRVDGWPAYAAAGRSRTAIVARWRERVAGLFGLGMTATLGLALLAVMVRRAWRAAEAAREGLEERVRGRTAELARRTGELADSEGRLRLALEAADLGTWEADLAAGTSARSPRTAEILGLGAEEVSGPLGGWRDRIHPADLPQALAAFEAFRRGEVDRYAAEYRVRHPDGRWAWVESRARPVTRDAAGQPLRIAGTLQDVTARREAEARRALLAREVDHRAKNALAVVQAALRLTPRSDPERYAAAVEGRVAALARAHTLLAEQRWAGAELRQILEGELAAFLSGSGAAGEPRAELGGPVVQVAASAAQSLSLAVHELATNAVKYGALSVPAGRVRVRWSLDPKAEQLRLAWREIDGPPLQAPPERRGFGSRVIAATIRDQLGGLLDAAWHPGGLEVEMRLPLARVQAGLAAEDGALQPVA
jgi:PAS domain S-box-containing protein